MIAAAQHQEGNPFLDPILIRARVSPESLMGVFHNGVDWHPVNLANFIQRAQQFSVAMAEAGVGAGDIVLIILKHDLDAHAAFVGAMMIGAVPSFMPYPNSKQHAALYWRQHRQVFKNVDARAILVYEELRQDVADAASGCAAAVLTCTMADGKVCADIGHTPSGEAIALLQHSSGTTGLKKGVQLTYQAICDQLEAYVEALGLRQTPEPRIASWLPLYHDMGLITSFLLPIWIGAPILSIDPFEWTKQPTLLFDAIEQYRATHVWLPNFALLHLARGIRSAQNWDLNSLVTIVCCSEPCKPEAFDAFLERYAKSGVTELSLQTSYAMAETVFAVTQTNTKETVRRLCVDRDKLQKEGLAIRSEPGPRSTVFLSNGFPISGCRVRILKSGEFVDDRVIGEVCIKSPWLFSGYHNNSDATRRAFKDGWLLSGDLGFLDCGELFLVGRSKDVIIVSGENVFAHDVEAAVSRVPNVKRGRAVAFGYYVEAFGSEKLVVVAERNSRTCDDAHLIRLINHAVLDEVGIGCGDVRLVDEGWLVKTTSGKMSRSENLSKYIEHFLSTRKV